MNDYKENDLLSKKKEITVCIKKMKPIKASICFWDITFIKKIIIISILWKSHYCKKHSYSDIVIVCVKILIHLEAMKYSKVLSVLYDTVTRGTI